MLLVIQQGDYFFKEVFKESKLGIKMFVYGCAYCQNNKRALGYYIFIRAYK